MKNLIQAVIDLVTPETYYPTVFPDIKWFSGSESRVKCCFHEDSHPSLHINRKSGAWYCHGCTAGGRHIVSFASLFLTESHNDAAVRIFDQFIRPVVNPDVVDKNHSILMRTPSILKYLVEDRHVSLEVIKHYKIGWTGSRVSIPIMNEYGLYINIKFYDPLSKKHGSPKFFNYRIKDSDRVFGTPAIFPIDQFEQARKLEDPLIFVSEGEIDALSMISAGVHAVTNTAGCKTWDASSDQLFAGLNVVVAYDNDPDGVKYRGIPFKHLGKIARTIRNLDVPKKMGKDVNDWIKRHPPARNKEFWVEMAASAKLVVDNPHRVDTTPYAILEASLDVASKAECFGKQISVKALITGKDPAPYFLPARYRVTCARECDDCPLIDSEKEFIEHSIVQTNPDVLNLIDQPKAVVTKALASMAGFAAKPDCRCRVDIVEAFNIENILLIPTLDSDSHEYVRRSAYYVGHGLHANRPYEFIGTTTPHPRDQHATHLFTKARPIQDVVENFELTPDLREQLLIFRPPERVKVFDHLTTIARWMSSRVTKIRQRDDLHILVDLVYHSVNGFTFNRELVTRGMLDVLIIGDTRCGKGKVTESLMRYYGLGAIASGENCSFAGLIGGLQQAGTRWLVTWGLIPLNNGRLVVIDEASALTTDDIGHMSRVRSEGVAEISKIIHESTQASTRLLWLSNPRSGRPMATYNAGVEAVKELAGASEDISRFDLALSVATNEVDSSIINVVAEDTIDDMHIGQEAARALILWTWSRNRDQVIFTDKALHAVLDAAVKFGNRYSSAIPLIQVENVRIKVAKLAAAIAARVFSTDETFTKLIVKLEHVSCAVRIITEAYSKPSMSYDRFSDATKRITTVSSTKPFEDAFKPLGRDRLIVINGLMTLHQVTIDALSDYIGDIQIARLLVSDLVKCAGLFRMDRANWYLKNPAFTQWLRSQSP